VKSLFDDELPGSTATPDPVETAREVRGRLPASWLVEPLEESPADDSDEAELPLGQIEETGPVDQYLQPQQRFRAARITFYLRLGVSAVFGAMCGLMLVYSVDLP